MEKVAVSIRTTLEELEHHQPLAKTRADNSTSHDILTSTVQQKWSKAFDMNIYWIKDRIKSVQFFLFWDRGNNNKADYFTKNGSPKPHKN